MRFISSSMEMYSLRRSQDAAIRFILPSGFSEASAAAVAMRARARSTSDCSMLLVNESISVWMTSSTRVTESGEQTAQVANSPA